MASIAIYGARRSLFRFTTIFNSGMWLLSSANLAVQLRNMHSMEIHRCLSNLYTFIAVISSPYAIIFLLNSHNYSILLNAIRPLKGVLTIVPFSRNSLQDKFKSFLQTILYHSISEAIQANLSSNISLL